MPRDVTVPAQEGSDCDVSLDDDDSDAEDSDVTGPAQEGSDGAVSLDDDDSDAEDSDVTGPTQEGSDGAVSLDDDDCDAEDSELRLENGHSVQCVVPSSERDEGGQQFELDEAALAALARQRGLGARPVVLISVAGAFRRGKSFLLDFMLRYLYAKESARGDGSWLGAPDEPLRGFSWRGGCARETQGLVLWSQPFPVTLPDGQKVAVLLMDTQGSFDEQSSYRDCSLIFALSTLLSSVLVYNLSQRIDESDLQHLQVFTEHAEAGGGAMPALQLLVRDWSAPADFGYGAAGGADYLRHKLQVREEKPGELRQVRERLARSFGRVACYLMPHPGLTAAADAAFRGQLADLEEKFKDSLRELVPLLLAPERLRVKTVDGCVLRLRDLTVYLRAYLDTFRHHVPSPLSIMRAQATARWLTAAAAARDRLRALAPALDAPAWGRAALRARLDAELRAALEQFAELAARCGDEAGLKALEKELNDQVAVNIYMNEVKIALAVSEAKEDWERATRALRDPALCAPARDLREDEAAARAAAVARYDRKVADPMEPNRAQLIEELEVRGAELAAAACATSARNHEAAARAALAALRDELPRGCLHPADLAAAHAAAAERARAQLRAARTRAARHDPDPYLTDLDKRIAVYLREHAAQNLTANEHAVWAAQELYDGAMALGDRCRHPADLAAVHQDALRRAADELRGRRTVSRAADRTDVYAQQLETSIEEKYAAYVRRNEDNNKAAVDEAYGVFCNHMTLNNVLRLSPAKLALKIANADAAAKKAFQGKRISEKLLGVNDMHYNQLVQKMRGSYDYYREKNDKSMSWFQLTAALGAVGIIAPVSGAVATGFAASIALWAYARRHFHRRRVPKEGERKDPPCLLLSSIQDQLRR